MLKLFKHNIYLQDRIKATFTAGKNLNDHHVNVQTRDTFFFFLVFFFGIYDFYVLMRMFFLYFGFQFFNPNLEIQYVPNKFLQEKRDFTGDFTRS